MLLQNTDSVLTATLSPSELSLLGIQKVIIAQNTITVYPNPVSTNASLSFTVAQSGAAALRVYDMNARQVALLFNGMAEKGIVRQVHFKAAKLSAGIYIAILQAPTGTVQQKIIIKR